MADYGGSAYDDYYGSYNGQPGGAAAAYSGSFGAPPRGPPGGGFGGYEAGPPQVGYGRGPPQMGGPTAGLDPNISPLDAEVALVLNEIRQELSMLEQSADYGHYRNTRRLLNAEILKLENNIDPEWIELDIEKEIKLVKKVLIPQFRYPRFNFVGKIIGPKAQTLQNLAKHFKCHVYVLGRGSTRDRTKEQELLASGDPNYAHYSGPLHVKIETTAVPSLAYKRIAGVMEVLKKLLEPVRETFIEGITAMPEPGENADKGENEAVNNNGETPKERDEFIVSSAQEYMAPPKPAPPPPQQFGGRGGGRSGFDGVSRGGGRGGGGGGGMRRGGGGGGGRGRDRGDDNNYTGPVGLRNGRGGGGRSGGGRRGGGGSFGSNRGGRGTGGNRFQPY